MQFHSYPAFFHECKRAEPRMLKDVTREDFYEKSTNEGVGMYRGDISKQTSFTYQMMSELVWLDDFQPYYNIWPAALSILLKLNLHKLACADVKPVASTLLLRLPVFNNQLSAAGVSVRSCLVSAVSPKAYNNRYLANGNFSKAAHTTVSIDGSPSQTLIFVADLGHTSATGVSEMPVRGFMLQQDKTVGQCLDVLTSSDEWKGTRDSNELHLMTECVRLYCTLCLIDSGSELLDKVVLNADREAYNKTNDEIFVQRAKDKGIVGWDVGRTLTERAAASPHFRNPHYAIRHTGPGRTIPKLRPIKGSFVGLNKIGPVPTGYGDDSAVSITEPLG